jgi:hypothetical protein
MRRLDARALQIGHAIAMRRLQPQLAAAQAEACDQLAEARREFAEEIAALKAELEETRLAYLTLKRLITQDREQRAEIDRMRQYTAALLVERDFDAPLQ